MNMINDKTMLSSNRQNKFSRKRDLTIMEEQYFTTLDSPKFGQFVSNCSSLIKPVLFITSSKFRDFETEK